MMRTPCRWLSLCAVAVALSSLCLVGCSTESGGKINHGHSFLGLSPTAVEGSGQKSSESRPVEEFSGIDVSGAFRVEIAQGTPPSVVVEADNNLLGRISTKVEDKTLKVQTTESVHPHVRMTLRITNPTIERLHIGGASDADVQPLRAQQLALSLSGASTIRMTALNASALQADASGSSTLSVAESGKVDSMVVHLSGSSKAKLGSIEATDATVDVSGASRLLVRVVNRIVGELSGASELEHLGSPKTVAVNTSGASTVRPAQ